jgi:hypothetical protein
MSVCSLLTFFSLVNELSYETLELNNRFNKRWVVDPHLVRLFTVISLQNVEAYEVHPGCANVACGAFQGMCGEVKLLKIVLGKTVFDLRHYLRQCLIDKPVDKRFEHVKVALEVAFRKAVI